LLITNENYSLAENPHKINKIQLLAELELAKIKSEMIEEERKKQSKKK
jgi:hypothetical protein